MKRIIYLIFCATITVLSACSDDKGDYPELMPTDQLLAEPRLSPEATNPVATTDDLEAKADALRARAAALRKPVLDEETRDRLQR